MRTNESFTLDRGIYSINYDVSSSIEGVPVLGYRLYDENGTFFRSSGDRDGRITIYVPYDNMTVRFRTVYKNDDTNTFYENDVPITDMNNWNFTSSRKEYSNLIDFSDSNIDIYRWSRIFSGHIEYKPDTSHWYSTIGDIEVKPNQEYRLSAPGNISSATVYFLDENKNPIDGGRDFIAVIAPNTVGLVVKAPSNAKYVRLAGGDITLPHKKDLGMDFALLEEWTFEEF